MAFTFAHPTRKGLRGHACKSHDPRKKLTPIWPFPYTPRLPTWSFVVVFTASYTNKNELIGFNFQKELIFESGVHDMLWAINGHKSMHKKPTNWSMTKYYGENSINVSEKNNICLSQRNVDHSTAHCPWKPWSTFSLKTMGKFVIFVLYFILYYIYLFTSEKILYWKCISMW